MLPIRSFRCRQRRQRQKRAVERRDAPTRRIIWLALEHGCDPVQCLNPSCPDPAGNVRRQKKQTLWITQQRERKKEKNKLDRYRVLDLHLRALPALDAPRAPVTAHPRAVLGKHLGGDPVPQPDEPGLEPSWPLNAAHVGYLVRNLVHVWVVRVRRETDDRRSRPQQQHGIIQRLEHRDERDIHFLRDQDSADGEHQGTGMLTVLSLIYLHRHRVDRHDHHRTRGLSRAWQHVPSLLNTTGTGGLWMEDLAQPSAPPPPPPLARQPRRYPPGRSHIEGHH